MNEHRIISGIKPSGKLHIGNYLGMIMNAVKLQEEFDCFFMVADMHSLTEDYNPKNKREQILDLAISLLASGLDPEKSAIFIQSHLPQHAELTWYFNTITPVGELERMTQFKDFVRRGHSPNVGLFDYPVLQAVDILLYKPTAVPVGQDQKKMSKSLGEGHVINMDDDAKTIEKKLARAVTDTGKTKTMSPGTKNLFALLEKFGEEGEIKFYQEAFQNGNIKYSDLKKNLAKLIAHHFNDYRRKKTELARNPGKVLEIIASGREKARNIASQTLTEVKEKMGLVL